MLRGWSLLDSMINSLSLGFANAVAAFESGGVICLEVVDGAGTGVLAQRHLGDGWVKGKIHFLREEVREKAGGAL